MQVAFIGRYGFPHLSFPQLVPRAKSDICASRKGNSLDARMPVRQLAVVFAVASLFYLLYTFVVPQILRFRFRGDLSWYDLGLHGFSPSRTYVSFRYTSPVVEISQYGSGCNPGLTFIAPRGDSIPHPGPMILDARGDLVWMKHNLNDTQDFKVQRYRGRDYLTYWEGEDVDGRGRGTWYMVCLFSFILPRIVEEWIDNSWFANS